MDLRYLLYEVEYGGHNMKSSSLKLTNKTILVTGAAGFIGSNLVMNLLNENHSIHIIGIDNMNDYYERLRGLVPYFGKIKKLNIF